MKVCSSKSEVSVKVRMKERKPFSIVYCENGIMPIVKVSDQAALWPNIHIDVSSFVYTR